jgi:hypothetical protein
LLTPRLSSLWVGLVTPVPAGLAMPLVESLRNEVVCTDHDIAAHIADPPEGLLPVDRAIALALRHTQAGEVSTRWASAGTAGAPSDPLPTDPDWAGGSLYVDVRTGIVQSSPAALWRVVEGIGGEAGWYSFPAAWAARGLADRLAGGVGLRRGRRDPAHLVVGDALDFWRVEAITPGSLLRLRAEMKLPGLAWLELMVSRDAAGRTVYTQRAIFQPRGLAGQAYWLSIAPFHGVVFGGMLRNITAAAQRAGPSPLALLSAGDSGQRLLAVDPLSPGHDPVAEVAESGDQERQHEHDRGERVERRAAVTAVLRRVDDH